MVKMMMMLIRFRSIITSRLSESLFKNDTDDDKGLFTYYVSRERGGGVSQMLTIADEGGRGGHPKADDC